MTPAPKPTALRRHLAPKQKVWLNWDGVFLMGPNYLRFLAAVDKTGTIREAGRAASVMPLPATASRIRPFSSNRAKS